MQIPLDVLPALPRLFLDYIRANPDVGAFYPHQPTIDCIERFSREHAGRHSAPREELAEVLEAAQLRWGHPGRSVGRLRDGAVAVVTGQQAGLFTGPLLSILKALTAVKLAKELDRRGVDAVPVFWIAADDHDHREIDSAGILNDSSRFERVHSGLENESLAPVSWLRYSDSIVSARDELFSLLPASDRLDEVRAIVERAYRPGVSPVDAFARMLLDLFGETDLIVVDPMDPALRELAHGALDQVRGRGAEVRQAVLYRTAAIGQAGYEAQVRVGATFTGLFAFRNGSRCALEPAEAGDVPASDLSPNVLVRPLVQDRLLPTAAYVGGAAEISYFAQAGAVYECLGDVPPPLYPRITATIVEPQTARILSKYQLGFEDVLGGTARLRQKVIGRVSDTDIFQDVQQGLVREAERLRPLLVATDKTLGGALDNSIRKVERQVDALRSRFVSAESRRDEVMNRQLALLEERLFPGKKLQERAVNVTSFLMRYGPQLIRLLDDRLELDGSVHQVMEL